MERHKDTNLSELYSIVEHFMHSYYIYKIYTNIIDFCVSQITSFPTLIFAFLLP